MSDRAVAYTRKSTKQEDVADDQRSVERQAQDIRRFITSKGWQLADTYEDDNRSGALFRSREALQRLLADAREGAFEHVVLFDLDRLGRDSQKTLAVLNELDDLGITVWDCSSGVPVDLASFEGELSTSLKTLFAQQFRQQIRKHTAASMRRRAEAGLVAGNPPFGYRAEGPKGAKKFVIIDDEAAVISEIYARAADGQGARTIAAALNARRVKAPRQKGQAQGWSMSTIHAVLRRSIYRGTYIYGQTQKLWGKELRRAVRGTRREKGQVRRDPSTWITVEMPELRIVDDAVAARVDLRLGDRRERYLNAVTANRKGRKNPNMARGRYLLSGGLLVCPTCGAHFEARIAPWHGLKDVYICSTRRRKPNACSNTLALSIAYADASVLDELEGEVLGTTAINRLLDLVETVEDDTIALTETRDRLAQEIQRLVDSIAMGVPADSLAPAIRQRENERAKIEARLRLPRPERHDREVLRAALEQRSASWRAELRGSPKVARELVRRLMGPITLWDPKDRPDWIPATTVGADGKPAEITWTSKARPGELFDGMVDQQMASPTGFEPVFWP